ncbi:hypothetical protein CJJ07_005125 [Candidozyma auris]|nr:hypothetical protein CJJ07_005125 [[Candida] auris]QEL59033.1 hypothetical protein CJJ09_001099 [[Candida] auris]
MVYFFKAKVQTEVDDFALTDEDSKYVIYMGRDKVENDILLKKSHPKNIWFHVDKHSSAHLYVQLSVEQQAQKFEDLKLEDDLLTQIGQLTKANSIKANKINNISIVYTPVDNLRSDGSMDIGTVTFINPKKVKRIHVAKKENPILNKLNKTKTEVSTEQFSKEQDELIKNWKRQKKDLERQMEQEKLELAKRFEEEKKTKEDPYASLFSEENLRASSNEFRNENWVEEEFW